MAIGFTEKIFCYSFATELELKMLLSNRLNPKQIANLPQGWHSDGNNLYLRVNGYSRTWHYRASKKGVRVTRSLGKFPLVSLKDARQKAYQLKYETKLEVHTKNITFEKFYPVVADNLVALRVWRDGEQMRKTYVARFATYAIPTLGKKRVGAITKDDVLALLQPLWATKPTIGKWLQVELKRLFDLAIKMGYRLDDNPSTWKGLLEFYLPSAAKTVRNKHHSRAEIADLPSFVKDVSAKDTMVSKAVLFGILTATRKQEFSNAVWSEIDLNNGVWSISPERRKDGNRNAFRVPLSEQALELLSSLPRTSDFVFGKGQYKAICPAYRSFGATFTPHGMRSTFRDWGQENGKDFTLMEKSLCHAVGNAVTKAYQRSDCLEQRRPIMQEWADYCYSAIKG